MTRRLLIAASVAVWATACGSSTSLPSNGRIAAERGANLYLMNPDGSELKKIRAGPFGPAVWTPDGKWLAFNTVHPITNEAGSYFRFDLWLMRPNGTRRHLVARDVPVGAISPDGKTMAFMNSCAQPFTANCEFSGENPMEIFTIGIDGRNRRRLTRNQGYDGDPSWSADGRHIAFATDSGVRIMDRDGRNSRVLTRGEWDSRPVWSPLGDRILVSTQRGWGVVSPDGGEIDYLHSGPRGPEWGAAWSPDGKQIAYLFRRADRWTAHDPMQIWVMNADGTHRHPITRTFGWSVPSWAPSS